MIHRTVSKMRKKPTLSGRPVLGMRAGEDTGPYAPAFGGKLYVGDDVLIVPLRTSAENGEKGDGSGHAAIPFYSEFTHQLRTHVNYSTPWTFTKSQLLVEVLAVLM